MAYMLKHKMRSMNNSLFVPIVGIVYLEIDGWYSRSFLKNLIRFIVNYKMLNCIYDLYFKNAMVSS